MKQVLSPEFVEYNKQVKRNAKVLADELIARGHTLVTGGTDNHLVLLNVRDLKLTGSKVEKMCDALHITLNKNTIIGDKSAVTPGGVRIGTPAVTSRGYKEADMKKVAEFIDRAVRLSIKIQDASPSKKLTDFTNMLATNPEVKQLASEVEEFATQFDMPGFDATAIDTKGAKSH